MAQPLVVEALYNQHSVRCQNGALDVLAYLRRWSGLIYLG